ncbi:MAG: NADH-quinone oxidoreductase subunit N [Candidatus Aminicenantes bacterium]|nr:NADH-quinone oxidoreductase subunit N [Candidatus Aminicenantes bacterium]
MNSLYALAPLSIIVLASIIILLLEVFLKKENKNYLGYISVFFLTACFIFCFMSWGKDYSYFNGSLLLDNFALFFFMILTIGTLLIILMSLNYISLMDANHGEFFALLLLALSGMFIMISSTDFLVIFLGLEVLSISSYALAGLKKKDEQSSEASVKYFLLGSFASAFLVFGLAFLFGAFKTTDILGIIDGFNKPTELGLLAIFGLGMVIISFAFKIAFVPFHMWTPDVYQGSPTPVTAFFSVGPKAVGFVVLIRILYPYWHSLFDSNVLFTILWIVSALTMIFGNLIALRQTNVKRILAYSSIAHAGYILVGILAMDNASCVFYLTVYLFMNIGAFTAITAMTKKGKEYVELEDYAGAGFNHPWIGAAFAVFLFSLAGFPPLGGFLAKFYVFAAAVKEGLISLVVIGILASLVSVYYYLRIVVFMYMHRSAGKLDIQQENPALLIVLFLCLYGVLQLGIFPGNILVFIRDAVGSLPF